jgi:hypothetical protein
VIALPAADRGGEARAERADEKSDKNPQQQTRRRLPRDILGLASIRGYLRHAVLGIGWTEASFGGDQFRQVSIISRGGVLLPKRIG